ncbi:MAG: histidine kinase [Candidatus Dormiibacterota bacterium]
MQLLQGWRARLAPGTDLGLALVVAGAALLLLWVPPAPRSGATPLSVGLILLASLPLAWRRHNPFLVFLVVGAAALTHVALGYQNDFPVTFAVLVGLFTVAQYAPRRLAWLAAVLVAVLLPLNFGLDWSHQHQVVLSDIPFNYGLFVSAWVLGDDLRQRRLRLEELQELDRQREREQAERMSRAADQERLRISRELHDVIAHSITVMVVQAGGARRIVTSQPHSAELALREIERVGREALADIRKLLGLARSGKEGGVALPQPKLANLEPLLERCRGAGIEVSLIVQGDQRQLGDGVELSAYRIVQEALTNAMKHSRAKSAQVKLDYLVAELRVEISDDGWARLASDGAGQGLVGISERAAAFGGSAEAGPGPEGGWRVSARLPLGDAL